MPTFRFSYRSRRLPSEVRSWWVDMPDDYTARDPREVARRIVTVKRTETGRELITYYGRMFGPDRPVQETLVVKEPYRWSYDLSPAKGIALHDEFTATPDGTGARVEVETTVTFTTLATRIFGPLLAPLMRPAMRRSWASAVAACDSEAAGVPTESPSSGPQS
jgi:hypothetical protein